MTSDEVMCNNGKLRTYLSQECRRTANVRVLAQWTSDISSTTHTQVLSLLKPCPLGDKTHQLGIVVHLGGRKVDLRESEACLVYKGILGQPALHNKILP